MTVKIDGRKAEITRWGWVYQNYVKFAEKYGYPDAAYRCGSAESIGRTTLANGDNVTLLVSGKHATDQETLWIVESANGERHIIGEKGLRILNEVNEAITLLPDESLGGILREYNEVKRKARVGERILMAEATGVNSTGDPDYHNGDIYEIKSVTSGIARSTVGKLFYHREYVVLEPSDIIRIDDADGVNRGYRMVERKAAVGERVVITDWKVDNHVAPNAYKNGDIASVTKKDYYAIVPHVGNPDFIALKEDEYRVLEPLTDAIPTQTPQLSSLDPVDQYADNIAALTTKVQALEERVATLESYKSFEDSCKRLSESLRKFTKCDPIELGMTKEEVKSAIKVASGPVSYDPPGFAVPPKQTDQQVRDEIVARAKADVKRLRDVFGQYELSADGGRYACNATFHVNDTKRKVTVILRGVNSGKIRAVGRAICAPGEVFNVHIGKAIALYRALGLVVPSEYMFVPAPTDAKAGDVVELTHNPRYTLKYGWSAKQIGEQRDWVRIIDDSREESEGVNA